MVSKINGNFSVNVKLETLRMLLCNPDNLKTAIDSTGAEVTELSVADSIQKCEVTIRRKLNLRELLPKQALPISGLYLSESRLWDKSNTSSITGTSKLRASDIQLEINSTLNLLDEGIQTTVEFSAEVTCKMPFFGNRIEQASSEYFSLAVKNELAALVTQSA